MSTRGYTALEGGQACFGLATFLLFLFRCCRTEEETKGFLGGLRAIFEDTEQKAA